MNFLFIFYEMERALYNDLEVIALNEIPGALYIQNE